MTGPRHKPCHRAHCSLNVLPTMIQSITSAIRLALQSSSADFSVRRDAPPVTTAQGTKGAPVQLTPLADWRAAVDKTVAVGKAAAHIAPLMNPIGFLASAFTGPRIETTDARSFSVPQLMANATVNLAEKTYAQFSGDMAYVQPKSIASWGELAQGIAPSKESLLEAALFLATKGKKSGPLLGVKIGKTNLKTLREQVKQAETTLKDQRGWLDQTINELSVYKAKPSEFAAQIGWHENSIAKQEKAIAAQEKTLASLRRQEAKLSTPAPKPTKKK